MTLRERGDALLRETSHVGFTVSDLDRSVEFYTTLFGVGPSHRQIYEADYLGRIVGYPGCRIDVAFFHLPATDVFLELDQYLSPVGHPVDMETFNPGRSHLSLETDDLEAEYERLVHIGAEFRHPGPVEITYGPYKGGKGVYFRDADGISIELRQPPPS